MMRASLRAAGLLAAAVVAASLLTACENAVTGDSIRTGDSDTAKIGLLLPDSVTARYESCRPTRTSRPGSPSSAPSARCSTRTRTATPESSSSRRSRC